MKRVFTFIALVMAIFISSCNEYDDSKIWDKLNDHEGRIAKLEELCKQLNTNIDALQTLVNALEINDYITHVAPVYKDGIIIGYNISFAHSETITIYHGEDGMNGEDGKDGVDGKDGYTPNIGVMQDTDGIYYWTIDGSWLLDNNGNKIKAIGTDGVDGTNGTDGVNGENGMTPRLKIENDYWYISYDNGETWEELGKALERYNNLIEVTYDTDWVYFTLANDVVITIPRLNTDRMSEIKSIVYIPRLESGKIIVDYHTKLASIDFQISPKDAVNDLQLIWETALKVNAVQTSTRAIDLINLPIVAFNGDSTNGIITIEVDGTNLGENFYKDGYVASINLSIDNGLTEYHSPYIFAIPSRINFKDSVAESLCEKWDINKDGEISYYEASLVTSIGTTFKQSKMGSFDEFQFFTSVKDIDANAFESCSQLETIILPKNATAIGASAFKNCKSLKSIEMPSQIVLISEYAFSGCSALTDIVIPDSVLSIGTYAFSETSNITIGRGVVSFGSYAFSNCKGELIVESTIPDFSSSTNSAFYDSKFETITFGENVQTIGSYAFYNCTTIKEIVMSDSITEIHSYAFYNNSALSNLTIGASVNTIGSYAFQDCDSLKEVVIPNNVTKINYYAFYYCSNLTTVTIGENVSSIGENAFYSCSKLAYIYCKSVTPPAIYYYSSSNKTFSTNSNIKIYVPVDSYISYTQYTSGSSNSTSENNWYYYKSYVVPYNYES